MIKTNVLIGLMIVTVVSIVTFMVVSNNNPLLNGDLVRMQYFTGTESTDVYWIELSIQKDGESKFMKFMGHDILEAKYGNLTGEEVESLINSIESQQFYEMLESYEHEEGLLCDGDLTMIAVKEKQVSAHCDQAPSVFYQIRDALMEVGANLPYEQYGVFVRAEKLDIGRIEKIEESFEFVSVSEELYEYPLLKKAIEKPREFVHIGSWNNTEIDNLVLEGYNYFFIKTGNNYYQVNAFYTENWDKLLSET